MGRLGQTVPPVTPVGPCLQKHSASADPPSVIAPNSSRTEKYVIPQGVIFTATEGDTLITLCLDRTTGKVIATPSTK